MTDRFVDRVSDLAGRTTRTLEQVCADLEEVGLYAQANTLRNISREHAQISVDCLVETQPIEVQRYNLKERIERSMEEVQEISADLLSRGKPGHSEMSEAADLIGQAMEQQSE